MNTQLMESALQAAGVSAGRLDAAHRLAVISKLRERLAVDVTAHAPWDDPAAPQGCRREDGWELIPAHVGPTPCLVFLDGAQTVWGFANGVDLLAALKQAPPLEFYVCDEAASYLLCSNHHDVVVGWGAGAHWVETLRLSVPE